MNKILSIVIYGFVLIVVLSLMIWAFANQYLIPRVILPEVKSFLEESNKSSNVKIYIGSIGFKPFYGFMIDDIKITAVNKASEETIANAKEVDLDINYFALLNSDVRITRFTVADPNLKVKRGKDGLWNIEPLFKLGLIKPNKPQKYSFKLDRIIIKNGKLYFEDTYDKHNSINRTFVGIDMDMSRPTGEVLDVVMVSGGGQNSKEILNAAVRFDGPRKLISGGIKLKTSSLRQYWRYYIHELVKPWDLITGEADAKCAFLIGQDYYSVNGIYIINKCVLKNGGMQLSGNLNISGQKTDKISSLEASILNFEAAIGDMFKIENGSIEAFIKNKSILLRKASGAFKKKPFDLNGKIMLGRPLKISFDGSYANIENKIFGTLFSSGRISVDWKAKTKKSSLSVYFNLYDYKSLYFSSALNGNIDLKDAAPLLDYKFKYQPLEGATREINQSNVSGRVIVKGNIGGHADKFSTLFGNLDLNFTNFYAYNWEKRTFDLNINAQGGIFNAVIPSISLYDGTMSGKFRMGQKLWGVELYLDNLDISQFSDLDDRLKNMKGKFTGNVSLAAPWKDISLIQGGGYIDARDCELRQSPIFQLVEEGIASVNKGFKLPNFKEVKGNFQVANKSVKVADVFCNADDINLNISGAYLFSGKADFTLGIRFMGTGMLRTVRQVLLPFTIGFDVLTSVIKIKISGTWPDLAQSTSIEPMKWLQAIFPQTTHYDPQMYSLDKVWGSFIIQN